MKTIEKTQIRFQQNITLRSLHSRMIVDGKFQGLHFLTKIFKKGDQLEVELYEDEIGCFDIRLPDNSIAYTILPSIFEVCG